MPIPNRSTSPRATSTLWRWILGKRLTPNGRLEKNNESGHQGMSEAQPAQPVDATQALKSLRGRVAARGSRRRARVSIALLARSLGWQVETCSARCRAGREARRPDEWQSGTLAQARTDPHRFWLFGLGSRYFPFRRVAAGVSSHRRSGWRSAMPGGQVSAARDCYFR